MWFITAEEYFVVELIMLSILAGFFVCVCTLAYSYISEWLYNHSQPGSCVKQEDGLEWNK